MTIPVYRKRAAGRSGRGFMYTKIAEAARRRQDFCIQFDSWSVRIGGAAAPLMYTKG
jgi:hypothetical protein